MTDPIRLLLIEDNAGDARLLEAHLEDAGFAFELEWRRSLEEGIAAVEGSSFDVLLLDLHLPDSEGLETVERCTAQVGGAIPVVVLTGREDSDTAVRSVRAGAQEFLVKGELTPQLVARTLRLVLARRRERRLRISEEEHRLLFRKNPQPMFIYDPEALRLEAVNDRLLEQYGYTRAEMSGLDLDRLWAEDRSDELERFLARAEGEDGRSGPWHHRRSDGSTLLVETVSESVTWEGRERRLVAAADVTERKQLEERLRHQAFHDSLTGLPNRSLFRRRLEKDLARARRHGGRLGLLLVDLNRFKGINDSLGHAAGDRVLKEIGRRLSSNVRREDTASRPGHDLPSRLGGDEFAILFPDLGGAEDLSAAAERISHLLHKPFHVAGKELELEFTIGGALFGIDDSAHAVDVDDPDDLLRMADQALYRAKEAPGFGFEVFSETDRESTGKGTGLLEREQDLRRGLDADEFEAHYQPIVEVESGRVRALEALARWNHPERGIVRPGEFIHLAEEMGLIRELGEKLLSSVFREMAEVEKQGGGERIPPITLNVSAHQFEDSTFAETLASRAKEHGVDLARVRLEVTESTLMEAADGIQEARALGVGVLVDDFGTGYSSFRYIRDLEVDGIKIDLSFIQGLRGDEENAAIVETMILLGRKLGLPVVAEGVETEDQRYRLIDLGCEFAQGYLFARPAPYQEAMDRLCEVDPPAPELL